MSSDLRYATIQICQSGIPVYPGWSGRLRHGQACAILPRIIGQGNASELLFTGLLKA
jgi:hypothetical protein